MCSLGQLLCSFSPLALAPSPVLNPGAHPPPPAPSPPQQLDYGTVSVGTTATRHLLVANTLSAPIQVVLDVKAVREFKGTKATSQVRCRQLGLS